MKPVGAAGSRQGRVPVVRWIDLQIRCVLGRELMGCWGLLGWLLIVSQWIIPENSPRLEPVSQWDVYLPKTQHVVGEKTMWFPLKASFYQKNKTHYPHNTRTHYPSQCWWNHPQPEMGSLTPRPDASPGVSHRNGPKENTRDWADDDGMGSVPKEYDFIIIFYII